MCSWAISACSLPAMQAAPDQPIASREADLSDTRLFRQFNTFPLPGDQDGAPTWNNLLADLRALLLKARPEVIVMPHASLDPHPDHICAQAAVVEALQGLAWQPSTLLGYANHLHDNDRWPMGPTGSGVACRRCSTLRSPWSRTVCRCRSSSSGTRPWRWG